MHDPKLEEITGQPGDHVSTCAARAIAAAQDSGEWLASPEGQEHARRMAAAEAANAAREAAGEVHDEAKMRESKPPAIETPEDLIAYINSLVNGKHDYGTCVYAMSLAATAAFNYVAGRLGVTGFQASCADLDVLRRTRNINGPFMLVKGENALYPQHNLHADLDEALNAWRPWLRDEAKKLLSASGGKCHPDVEAHWTRIAAAHKDDTDEPPL